MHISRRNHIPRRNPVSTAHSACQRTREGNSQAIWLTRPRRRAPYTDAERTTPGTLLWRNRQRIRFIRGRLGVRLPRGAPSRRGGPGPVPLGNARKDPADHVCEVFPCHNSRRKDSRKGTERRHETGQRTAQGTAPPQGRKKAPKQRRGAGDRATQRTGQAQEGCITHGGETPCRTSSTWPSSSRAAAQKRC